MKSLQYFYNLIEILKYRLRTRSRLATTQPSLHLLSVNLAHRCFTSSFPALSSFPLFCLVFPWQDEHGKRKAEIPVGHPLDSSGSLTTVLAARERREALRNPLSHPKHMDCEWFSPAAGMQNSSSATKQQADSQNITETAEAFLLPPFLSSLHLPQRLERPSPSYQAGGFL